MMKINESYETSETPDPDSLSSISSDEGSFVVLGTSPHESERQPASSITITSQLPDADEFAFTDYQPPSNLPELLSSDLSAEEVHKKLEEVMQHNLNLKELLYQNNVSWKHNYQILLTWQEELSKQQQKNNEKFAQNKEFTMKLEADNSELKEKIAELERRLTASSAKAERTEGSTQNETKLEVSSVVEQLNEQWEELLTKSDLSGENFTFPQLDMQSNENTGFATSMKMYERRFQEVDRNPEEKTERMNSAKAQSQLKKLFSNSQELVEERKSLHEEQKMKGKQNSEYHEFHVRDYIEKVENLTAQLVSKEEDLAQHRQQNAELTDAVKKLKQENEEIPVLKAQMIQNNEYHEFQLQDYVEKVDNLTAQLVSKEAVLAQQKQQIAELTDAVKRLQQDSEEIPVLKAQVQGYVEKVDNLTAQLVSKKAALAQQKQQIAELTDAVKRLQQESEEIPILKAQAKQNSEYHELQVRGYLEKVDNLTAQLMLKEEAFVQQKQQIAKLTSAVKRLKQESEEIPILKAQLEVYQLDCIAEIEARANLAGEKEKIAEDLRKLHRQNKELQEELEKYRVDRNHSNSGPGRPYGGVNRSTQ